MGNTEPLADFDSGIRLTTQVRAQPLRPSLDCLGTLMRAYCRIAAVNSSEAELARRFLQAAGSRLAGGDRNRLRRVGMASPVSGGAAGQPRSRGGSS